MLTFENAYLAAIGSPPDVDRVRPYLSQPFDPIVLERPGFLGEIGLRPADGLLLRAGAVGQQWLRGPFFWRALTEEIRSHVPRNGIEGWLDAYPDLPQDEQYLTLERIYSRLEQLAGMRAGAKAETVCTELGMSRRELDEERRRWREQSTELCQQLAAAIALQILGVGVARAELVEQVVHHWATRFLVFWNDRPLLTDVNAVITEVRVKLENRIVSKSFAAEVEKNSGLGPELWARNWLEYLRGHRSLQPDEFSALLDHMSREDRHKWPNLVPAGSGAKARRAVAAVACELLESLAGAPDQGELQRLYELVDNFSERYDMEAIVKRRFPA